MLRSNSDNKLNFSKAERLFTMQKNHRWRELCALAAVEQDPKKLLELVAEISRLFDEEHAVQAEDTDVPIKDPSSPGQDNL